MTLKPRKQTRSFGNFVCRKVKTISFKKFSKIPEDVFVKATHLSNAIALIS